MHELLRAGAKRTAQAAGDGEAEPYGVEEQLIAMGLYLLVGVGLSAYAALRTRPAHV